MLGQMGESYVGMRVFEIEGGEYPTERDYPSAREGIVTPGYFSTFQTSILDGRAFEFADTKDNLPVALVNQSFAREFFELFCLGVNIEYTQEDVLAANDAAREVLPDLEEHRTLVSILAESGLDPDQWFRNVEQIAARRVGREPVQYVSNIYKYYIAYTLLLENYERRKAHKQGG